MKKLFILLMFAYMSNIGAMEEKPNPEGKTFVENMIKYDKGEIKEMIGCKKHIKQALVQSIESENKLATPFAILYVYAMLNRSNWVFLALSTYYQKTFASNPQVIIDIKNYLSSLKTGNTYIEDEAIGQFSRYLTIKFRGAEHDVWEKEFEKGLIESHLS